VNFPVCFLIAWGYHTESAVKPIRERCTIVVAGSWNQEIFSPSWVARVLGLGSEPALNLILGPNGLTFRLNFGAAHLLDVMPHQIMLAPTEFSDAAFGSIEQAAISILRCLSETPVRGLGVNFGFDVPRPPATLTSLFRLSDDERLTAAGAVVGSTAIARKLSLDGRVLNLTVKHEGGPCKLDFNYHHDANRAEDVIAHLDGCVAGLKATAVRLAEQLYGLTAEGS